MNYSQIVRKIKDEISIQGKNQHSTALGAGLPVNSVRYLFEGRKTSLVRVIEICDFLGLEFKLEARASPQTSSASQPIVTGALTIAGGAPSPGDIAIISAPPVDVSQSEALVIRCPLLRELLAQLCEEWAAMDPRGKKKMYARFRAYFPELQNEHLVHQVAWEVVDPPEDHTKTNHGQ